MVDTLLPPTRRSYGFSRGQRAALSRRAGEIMYMIYSAYPSRDGFGIRDAPSRIQWIYDYLKAARGLRMYDALAEGLMEWEALPDATREAINQRSRKHDREIDFERSAARMMSVTFRALGVKGSPLRGHLRVVK